MTFEQIFIHLNVELFSVENMTFVRYGVMTLRISYQVLCDVLSYDFYVMTLRHK